MNKILRLGFLFLSAIFFSSTSFISVQAQEYQREEVQFKNGRFTINGQLVLADSSSTTPVLIFLVGDGRNSSYRTNYQSFIKENLEDLFLAEGISLLYTEKRGIGGSKGRWQRTNLYERADDTKAAIDFLKTHSSIDSTRIGIVGHGQGGWVAQIIGDRYRDDIKLIASLAAPTYDIRLKLTNEYYSNNLCEGMPDNVAFDKASKKAISDINWVSWFPFKKEWRQLREQRFFSPEPHLLELEMPAFFTFNENDPNVYPSWATGALNEAFNNEIPDNFYIHIIQGANHNFRMTNMCTSFDEAQNYPYSEYFQTIFREWVLDTL